MVKATLRQQTYQQAHMVSGTIAMVEGQQDLAIRLHTTGAILDTRQPRRQPMVTGALGEPAGQAQQLNALLAKARIETTIGKEPRHRRNGSAVIGIVQAKHQNPPIAQTAQADSRRPAFGVEATDQAAEAGQPKMHAVGQIHLGDHEDFSIGTEQQIIGLARQAARKRHQRFTQEAKSPVQLTRRVDPVAAQRVHHHQGIPP